MAEIRQILESKQFNEFCNKQVTQLLQGEDPAVVINWNGKAMIHPRLNITLDERVDSLAYYGIHKVSEFVNAYIKQVGGWDSILL